MSGTRATEQYPRRGERIAPNALREFLLESIPKRFLAGSDTTGLRLCDLDQRVWDRLPEASLVELSKLVVTRLASSQVGRAIRDRRFPQPLRGIRLEGLRLENRTRRCLAHESSAGGLEMLGSRTFGSIMSLSAFGARCLVDLLTALESTLAGADASHDEDMQRTVLSEKLTSAAAELAKLPAAKQVSCHDPRFASLMGSMEEDAQTAYKLAKQLMSRSRDPADPPRAADNLRQLADRIRQMPDLTLEQELTQIFAATPDERNRQILIGYFGWEAGRQRTLTEVGTRFGITRERIRQICAKLTKKPKGCKRILAPVMDCALRLIEKRLPRSVDELEEELASKGLTTVDMSLPSLAAGAGLLERPVRFSLVGIGSGATRRELAVRTKQVDAARAVIDIAKKDVYFHGLASLGRIEQLASRKYPDRSSRALVRHAVRLMDEFSWLDERAGWFRLLSISKHGLPKAVEKILAVAEEVTVDQMRAAMSRNRRLWKNPPPENVLLEFCRQMTAVKVRGKRIASDPPRDWRKVLTGVEKKLVSVLREHGPVMERGAMEDLCVESGMNRFSFHAFVSWSPVIEQFGHSVYGLLGAGASRRQVDRLIARRRSKHPTHRVLDGHGHTNDGRVWLSYLLSKAASTYAVITIPAALKQTVHGRFKLFTSAGVSIGTLATKDGRAWGLGAFMRRQEAKQDDQVVLTLDLKEHTAVVVMGEEAKRVLREFADE